PDEVPDARERVAQVDRRRAVGAHLAGGEQRLLEDRRHGVVVAGQGEKRRTLDEEVLSGSGELLAGDAHGVEASRRRPAARLALPRARGQAGGSEILDVDGAVGDEVDSRGGLAAPHADRLGTLRPRLQRAFGLAVPELLLEVLLAEQRAELGGV